MTSYNIHITLPELSKDKIIYTFDLPTIEFDGVEKNAELATYVYDQLSSISVTSLKSSLLTLLEALF
jgi:hypothetical protein